MRLAEEGWSFSNSGIDQKGLKTRIFFFSKCLIDLIFSVGLSLVAVRGTGYNGYQQVPQLA